MLRDPHISISSFSFKAANSPTRHKSSINPSWHLQCRPNIACSNSYRKDEIWIYGVPYLSSLPVHPRNATTTVQTPNGTPQGRSNGCIYQAPTRNNSMYSGNHLRYDPLPIAAIRSHPENDFHYPSRFDHRRLSWPRCRDRPGIRNGRHASNHQLRIQRRTRNDTTPRSGGIVPPDRRRRTRTKGLGKSARKGGEFRLDQSRSVAPQRRCASGRGIRWRDGSPGCGLLQWRLDTHVGLQRSRCQCG